MEIVVHNRKNIYGFLTVLFLKEPTIEIVKKMKEPSVASILINFDSEWKGLIASIEKEETFLEDLVVEYTRLFIGPGKHISPYESTWCEKDGLLWGESTSNVKKFIEATGLEYKTSWTGMPDHIGVEMEFMYKLVSKESDAWKQNDKKTATEFVEIEKKFVDEHITKWIPKFCDEVIEETNSQFYRLIAKLTKEFVQKEVDFLSNILYKETLC